MAGKILNQPWEDVADDVTGAIEKAVQPLLKKAVDDIYSGLLDATQDYLKDNLAFNIASRIDCAEREARDARQENARLREALTKAQDELNSLWSYEGKNLQVYGWHLNGEPEPFDNFLTDNDCGAREAIDAVIGAADADMRAQMGEC